MRIPRGVKWCTVEWLECPFLVISSERQLKGLCSQFKNTPDRVLKGWNNAGLSFVLEWEDGALPCVIIRNKDLITHEATHMAEDILDLHDIPHRAKNMYEVRAYMIQHVDKLIRKALGV